MYFGYDVCPKCMNTLIEREQSMENDDFEEYSGKYCLGSALNAGINSLNTEKDRLADEKKDKYIR